MFLLADVIPPPLGPQDVSNAITQALIQGGSQWLVATLVAFLPALWTLTLFLHLGRPYVLRTLSKLGLRLGADIWWMSYLLMRDGLMIVTFGLSWIFFLPNLVTTLAFPITGSLAATCLLASLAVKLTRRVDDDIQAYRLSTAFLVLGATLYFFPLVFAVENTTQVHFANIGQALTSNAQPTIALTFTWISLVIVTCILSWMFINALGNANRAMAKQMSAPRPTPLPTA